MVQLITYSLYLLTSLVLTVWVGRTLFKHGRPFLVDAFRGNEMLADSVNHLLVVGFYLVNLGYVTLYIESRRLAESPTDGLVLLCTKIGGVAIVLGVVHFVNLMLISRFARTHMVKRLADDAGHPGSTDASNAHAMSPPVAW